MAKLSSNANVPFLRTNNGTMYDLGLPTVFPIPGSTYTSATVSGLNPRGGYAGGAANLTVPLIPVASDATVWQYSITGGVMSSVGTDIVQYLPGWLSNQPSSLFNSSLVLSINDAGQAVGETALNYGVYESPTNNTFIYNVSTHAASSLSALGLFFPFVYSGANYQTGLSQLINDRGQVVGEEQVGGVWHAAIWDASNGLRDLNALYGPSGANILPSGFVLNAATAINDSGFIVGYGTDLLREYEPDVRSLLPTLPGDANLDGASGHQRPDRRARPLRPDRPGVGPGRVHRRRHGGHQRPHDRAGALRSKHRLRGGPIRGPRAGRPAHALRRCFWPWPELPSGAAGVRSR